MRRYLIGRVRRVVVVAMAMTLMVAIPLRTAFMSLVLPTPWVDTDTVHLYHVMHDFQNFDLDSEPFLRDPAYESTQVNLSDYTKYVDIQKAAYPEFWKYFTMLKTQHSIEPHIKQRLETIETFKPLMTVQEKAQLTFAFDTFHMACTKAHLTYFIMEATLMGVLRHHALIPWDDDIDVVMSASQWPRIRSVLGHIKGFTLYTPPDSQWKFSMDMSKSLPGKPFKFPHIDIFFYDEDDTHIWSLTKGLKHDLVYSKSDIFPLQLRPFEGLMVPVPCNLDLVVHKSHDQNECVTPEYVHKTSTSSVVKSIDCKLLHEFYPFIFRGESPDDSHVVEHLRVGMKEMHKKVVPVGCAK